MYICRTIKDIIKEQLKLKDMARERNESKTLTFLSLSAQGELYTTSKEPKEGYTEEKKDDGGVYYKKVFSGTEFGKISYLGIIEKEFNTGKVKYVRLSVENEDAVDIIQLPLENQKGIIKDEVKKLTAILPNIDFSRELTISSNRRENKRGYIEKVLFVNYIEDGKIGESLKFALKFGEGGDVPPFEKKEVRGEIKYDFTLQDEFIYNELLKQIERFKEFKASQDDSEGTVGTAKNKVEEEAPKEVAKKHPKAVEDYEDELPF